MYSLLGSLVIMRDCEAGTLMGMFARVSQFKYRQFRRQMDMCTVQKWFTHVLIVHTFIAHALPIRSVAHIKTIHVYSGLSLPLRPYEWSYG